MIIPFSSSPVSSPTYVLTLCLSTAITSSVPPVKPTFNSSTSLPTNYLSTFLNCSVKAYEGFAWSSALKSMKKSIILSDESSMSCLDATIGSKPAFTWLFSDSGTSSPPAKYFAILEAKYFRFSGVSGYSLLLFSESSALDFCISLLIIFLTLGCV